MRRWLWFAIPFTLVLAAGAVAGLLVGHKDDGPCDAVDVTFADVAPGLGCVRLVGTAHYDSVVTQHTPATLLAPARTWYLFGFFPENQTSERGIRVLVRTERPPERLVAFETMTVEGRLLVPTKDRVPPQTETILSKQTPYFFDDGVMLLQATRILSEDGVWEMPVD